MVAGTKNNFNMYSIWGMSTKKKKKKKKVHTHVIIKTTKDSYLPVWV